MLRKIAKLISDFFLPRRCVACNSRLHDGETVLCSRCLLIESLSAPLFADSTDNVMLKSVLGCGDVLRGNALFEYRPHGGLAQLIYKMKYDGRSDIAVYMGRHIAKVLQSQGFFDGVDVIVPVPITRMRRFHRGFNQSEMLASGISEVTGLPIDSSSFVRRRFSGSQTQLSGQQRQANVRSAFSLVSAQDISGRHVLVVDDIFTTGATLSECLREISQNTEGVRLSILTLGLTKS